MCRTFWPRFRSVYPWSLTCFRSCFHYSRSFLAGYTRRKRPLRASVLTENVPQRWTARWPLLRWKFVKKLWQGTSLALLHLMVGRNGVDFLRDENVPYYIQWQIHSCARVNLNPRMFVNFSISKWFAFAYASIKIQLETLMGQWKCFYAVRKPRLILNTHTPKPVSSHNLTCWSIKTNCQLWLTLQTCVSEHLVRDA